MTIDLQAERLTLNAVARLCGVHLATVWRWCLKGVDGRVLPSKKIGGRRYVLRDELDRFIAAQNQSDDSPAEPTRESARRAKAAESELDEIGIGR
ncbi:helix-turn-helix domain-containing protein [Thalassoroseus pseudoceratinae]|uniref:helix-turn-helix domain-containing protein n=1 Tax=Thalassoroseus pseudoceratinae TaxID=2713176 RepID=UPI0014226147|nr:helix-turn-helix domain-containing protein [Thalassoroseus pseudoceratinae]